MDKDNTSILLCYIACLQLYYTYNLVSFSVNMCSMYLQDCGGNSQYKSYEVEGVFIYPLVLYSLQDLRMRGKDRLNVPLHLAGLLMS